MKKGNEEEEIEEKKRLGDLTNRVRKRENFNKIHYIHKPASQNFKSQLRAQRKGISQENTPVCYLY